MVIRPVAFPVLPHDSALLRGFCGARRLRSFCFALAPYRFWLPRSGPPRKAVSCLESPLALGCPRQTGRTGETCVPQQNHPHRFHRQRRWKKGRQRNQHRDLLARHQDVLEERCRILGIAHLLASMRGLRETGWFRRHPLQRRACGHRGWTPQPRIPARTRRRHTEDQPHPSVKRVHRSLPLGAEPSRQGEPTTLPFPGDHNDWPKQFKSPEKNLREAWPLRRNGISAAW